MESYDRLVASVPERGSLGISRGRCASRALADETAPLFEGGPRPGGVWRHMHQTVRFRLAKNTGQTTSSLQERLACVRITRMRALRRVLCIT